MTKGAETTNRVSAPAAVAEIRAALREAEHRGDEDAAAELRVLLTRAADLAATDRATR